jgi:metalloendopeptidase OMA1, mitochondrial
MSHRPTAIGLLALLLVVVACTTVPVTGRRQVMMMSEGEEQKLGLDAYQEVLKKAKLATDPEVNAQVTRVGRRIADATGKTDYQWEFKVFEDKQANAFCLPGGKIAVYTGILPITRDDAGLAAVIGHEVAHAIARHGGERVSQQGLVQVLLGATSVALSQQNPAVQQVAIAALGGGAAVGYLLPYSRAQESEADYLGLLYMAKAGYHPSAARDLWVRMAEASKGRERPPEFLSTHPTEATRIKQIEGWIPEALKHYRPRP